ncbi:MAG TPA: GTPase HflX [Mesotoga sp.]|nr:GTPase HflX [Mesotoga sp.]HNR79567.1 GTPase HflX [Mesotoga infera]HON27526.1 GTPase HflX [Mesotoga infera]HRR44404.1 GTPase HflX [Mesotoga sp.]HRV01913.1 GTPase HflX [Mesotoga sp.]
MAVFSPGEQEIRSEIVGELNELARTVNYNIVETVIQNLDYPDPRHYLGKGKVDFARRMLESCGAKTVITRHELSPSQAFNLEKHLGAKVIDRTQLILKIFADHATTKEGKLEVELASLKYQLPRLKGYGKILSQTGGGIGTRGPGEKKLEIDRRLAQDRITRLKRELEELKRQREVSRKRRVDSTSPLVSFVGYTNVGKSSLVSLLSGENLLIQDKLFATLDTRVRRVRLTSGLQILVSDTVGFIRELPHELMESFRATLDEVRFSDLLVIVSDASDTAVREKLAVVGKTLEEIGSGEIESIHVLNKIDRCTAERLMELRCIFPESVMVSALKGENIDELVVAIQRALGVEKKIWTLRLKPDGLVCFMKFRDSLEIISQEYREDVIEIQYLSSDEIHERMISSICEEGKCL